MSGLRSILFQDLGTKALALILALAAYVHVLSTQDREMIYEVPLRIMEIPSGLALAEEPPSKARVRIRASGKDLIKLRTRPLEAAIRLDQARAGELQRPLLGSDLEIPGSIPTSSVEVIEPRLVHLTLEPIVTESKPVAVRTLGELPPDRALVELPAANPARVRVTGGQSRVAAVDSIPTRPIDLRKTEGAGRFQASLEPPAGLDLERDEVAVSIRTEEKVMRFFRFLPVLVVPRKSSQAASLEPDSATIVLAGASSVVQATHARGARLIAEIPANATGIFRVPLRPVLPGLSARSPLTIRAEPESVTVQLGSARGPTSTAKGS